MSHHGGHLGRSHSKSERERRRKEAETRAAFIAALSPRERLQRFEAAQERKRLRGLAP